MRFIRLENMNQPFSSTGVSICLFNQNGPVTINTELLMHNCNLYVFATGGILITKAAKIKTTGDGENKSHITLFTVNSGITHEGSIDAKGDVDKYCDHLAEFKERYEAGKLNHITDMTQFAEFIDRVCDIDITLQPTQEQAGIDNTSS